MMAPWRPLAFAAVLNMTVVVGVTTAQTVMVTKAPRGATIELALNATVIGTATADGTGKAAMPVTLPARGGRTDADVQVFVDVCSTMRRVLLVEPGLQPQPPQIDCTRRELPGVFLLRKVTTMVVEVTASAPAVWIRQGPVPNEWLGEQATRISSKAQRRPSPTGLVLFGGLGQSTYAYPKGVTCGTVTDCSGSESRLAYTAGATVWLKSFLGVEGSYSKPATLTLDGTGGFYRFTSTLTNTMLSAYGKLGLPLGMVRLYGLAGANRHQATWTTTQTNNDRTVTTADGGSLTIAGGTQKFVLRTAGWAFSYGGGIELWLAPKFGLYAEGERAKIKGDSRDGDPGKMDDRVTTFRLGIRFRLLGR